MPAYMNTVTVPTGTALAGGEAVQLTDAVRAIYSRELQLKALPIMKFLQFAEVREELGVEPGLEIKMLRLNNLKKGGPLQEGVRMQPQAMSTSMVSITVGERGNAIALSELTLRSAFFDVMNAATTLLARDMAIVLDTELRDVALSGTNVIYARNAKGERPSSRAEMDPTCVMNVATIKDAVEILATNNAPKFSMEGDTEFYICFVHPHQSRTLRDDPAWLNARQYTNPDQIFNGEIGRIDDVRFIETTLMPNGADPANEYSFDPDLHQVDIKNVDGTGTVKANLYRAVMFTEGYYGFAVALPPELRDNGVQDFGREHGLAWYAIWGAGILNNDYGVVIETV